MLTEVVPAPLLWSFTTRVGASDFQISEDLRCYLITKIYESEDPKWKRSGITRFFTMDNIFVDGNVKCRITGWIGSTQPETVLKIPRLTAIDTIRDLYQAYPLFSESFWARFSFNKEGHGSGVFSRAF
jgi:hypothetical protein